MILETEAPEIEAPETESRHQGSLADPVGDMAEANDTEATDEHQEAKADQPVDDGPTEQTDQPDDEEQFWKKLELIGKIVSAEHQRSSAQAEFDELTEDRKDAKAILDGAIQRQLRLNTELAELLAEKPLPVKPGSENEDQDEFAWKTKPTRELLTGIKGLGEKKIEAIVELAPTAWDLESLRGDASKAHYPFAEALPKGCGENVAQQIEDALLQIQTASNGPLVVEKVLPFVGQPSGFPEWPGPDGHERWAQECADLLVEIPLEPDGEIEAELEFEANDWPWRIGYDADGGHEECPTFIDEATTDEYQASARRDWLRGWATAEIQASEEDGDDK